MPKLRLHIEEQAARIADLERALALVHTHASEGGRPCVCGLRLTPSQPSP